MKRLIACLLLVCSFALAGCGIDKDGAKKVGSDKPQADVCYGDDKNPCWVKFDDGMRCLASRTSDSFYVYSECTGGAARQSGAEQ
jgi:hypothetical protein